MIFKLCLWAGAMALFLAPMIICGLNYRTKLQANAAQSAAKNIETESARPL